MGILDVLVRVNQANMIRDDVMSDVAGLFNCESDLQQQITKGDGCRVQLFNNDIISGLYAAQYDSYMAKTHIKWKLFPTLRLLV